MIYKQIYLTYQLKEIHKSTPQLKVLFCNLKQQSLLLRDGKHIVEFNYHTQTQIGKTSLHLKDTKLEIGICYSEEYDIYFILFEGWRLQIFKRQLHLLQQINFDSKYNVGLHFQEDKLLLIGVDEIDLLIVDIDTNIKTSKFVSSYHFDMKQLSKTSIKSRMDDWNTGFSFTNNLLFVWSRYHYQYLSKDLSIIQIKQKTPKFIQFYSSITTHENAISQFLFLDVYRYFLLGYQHGEIKVWKINSTAKKGEILVHTFEGHTKKVESLAINSSGRMFWSSAQDLTLQLWNLDVISNSNQQFTNIYKVIISGLYTDLQMISFDRFLVKSENALCFGMVNNNLKLLNSIADIVSYYIQPNYIILTLDSNTSIMINEDLSLPFTTFYPPPKSMEIKQVQALDNLFIMLIEGGNITITKLNNGKCDLQQCISSEQIKDFDGNHILQQIVEIKCLDLDIPSYDADFGQIGKVCIRKDQQIVLGLSKGSVIVVGASNPTKMYARMSYHRERIVSIDKLNDVMVTFCVEGWLKLIQFSETKIQCIKSHNIHIQSLKCFNNKLLCFSQKGPFQIFKLKNSNFLLYSYDKGNEHESQILSVDYKNRCFMTTAADSRIKVWSTRKILLIQINIELLAGAWFIGNQLLIAHNSKLSHISQTTCKLHTLDPKQVNMLHKESMEINIDDYYAVQKQQQKQVVSEQKPSARLTPRKAIFKARQRSPQVQYIGGQVYYEDNQPVIIYRGKFNNDLVEQSQQKLPAHKVKAPQKEVDYFHDWDAMNEYEKNRKNRFQPMRALPKLPNMNNSVELPQQQRIMTRRDLTLNRILVQSLMQ